MELGTILLGFLIEINLLTYKVELFDNNDTLITNLLQIDNIGLTLYVYGAALLIICSIILLLAMFSAIIISTPRSTDSNKTNRIV